MKREARSSRALADATRQLERDQRHAAARCRAADGRMRCDIDRDRLMLLDRPTRRSPTRFGDLVERRLAGEPVAYITGRRAFWTIDLDVGPGVLVPRPDSETLIEAAIEHFEGTRGPEADPRSRHRPRHPAARGARRMAGRDRPRHRRFATRRWPMPGAMPPARLRSAPSSGSATGRTASTSSFDLILCNPPYVADGRRAWPPASREYRAGRSAVRRRATGSTPIARSPRSCRACSRRAASPRSRSAPTRQTRSPRCSRATACTRAVAQRPRGTGRARCCLTWA